MPRKKNTEVRVYVVEYGRDSLMLRIKWPDGTQQHESAETNDEEEALRRAGAREAELRLQGPKSNGKMLWTAFKTEVDAKLINSLAPATQRKYRGVFKAVEKYGKPPILTMGQLTTGYMTDFIAAWRAAGAPDATLFGYLGHLKAAFAWAHDQGWMPIVPVIRKPTIDDEEPTKGRAITDEEFAKYQQAAPQVVKEQAAEWQRALKGLYLSGLRLEESTQLSWDIPRTIRVDLSGEYPMLHIPRSRQKKRKAELYPITRDFAEFLLETPEGERTGWVFKFPMPVRNETDFRRADTIGKVLSEIGEKSGVVVDLNRGKCVSAHDLRRSFGVRWSREVYPDDLQVLMRHASIETTMKYYTRQKSVVVAARIWKKGNLSGNNTKNKEEPQETETPTQ